MVGEHHRKRWMLTGRSARKSPTILSQCWDKRLSLGRIASTEWRTRGASCKHASRRGSRSSRGCLGRDWGPGMGAGAGRQEADTGEPGRRGRSMEPNRQQGNCIAGEEFDKSRWSSSRGHRLFQPDDRDQRPVRCRRARTTSVFVVSSTSSSPGASASTITCLAGS